MKIFLIIQGFIIIFGGFWILDYAKGKNEDPFEFIGNWKELQERNEVFIRSVFRVADGEFRVVMVRNVLSSTSIFYSLDGKTWKLLKISCQRPGECPRRFSYACVFTGYVGYISEDFATEKTNGRIAYFKTINSSEIVRHQVIDIRPTTRQKQHQLGVCVQPLFLYTNWPLLVMFFEYWLQQQATVFYIYYESLSQDVYNVVNYYKNTSRSIEIQLIDWSKIPNSKSPKDFDPNLYLYRLEPELAIFDCMYRMRKMAKFVAQTDIDEIIYLNSNGNLIDYLERLERTYPNMASVNFRSQRVRIDNSWNSLSTPENFNFYPLKYSAKFEDRIFERSLYSKNIYIPDRVENFDIHFRFPTKNRFIHYNASISDGLILHLRQLPDIFPWKSAKYSMDLRDLASKLDFNFFRRRSKVQFPEITNHFQQFGSNLTIEIENCRQRVSKKRREFCPSLELCIPSMNLQKFEWKMAKKSWTVIE